MRKQRLNPEQKYLLRDAAVFAFKMWLDGIKDFAFGFLTLGAVVIDLIKGRQAGGYLFYKVMKLGHRIDQIIDPYSGHEEPEEIAGPREPRDHLRG